MAPLEIDQMSFAFRRGKRSSSSIPTRWKPDVLWPQRRCFSISSAARRQPLHGLKASAA